MGYLISTRYMLALAYSKLLRDLPLQIIKLIVQSLNT